MQGFDHFYLAIPTDKQFHSVGSSCQLLQTTPAMLSALMAECEIGFAMSVDGVPMLSADSLKVLSDTYHAHIDGINSRIDAVTRAARNN